MNKEILKIIEEQTQLIRDVHEMILILNEKIKILEELNK